MLKICQVRLGVANNMQPLSWGAQTENIPGFECTLDRKIIDKRRSTKDSAPIQLKFENSLNCKKRREPK